MASVQQGNVGCLMFALLFIAHFPPLTLRGGGKNEHGKEQQNLA